MDQSKHLPPEITAILTPLPYSTTRLQHVITIHRAAYHTTLNSYDSAPYLLSRATDRASRRPVLPLPTHPPIVRLRAPQHPPLRRTPLNLLPHLPSLTIQCRTAVAAMRPLNSRSTRHVPKIDEPAAPEVVEVERRHGRCGAGAVGEDFAPVRVDYGCVFPVVGGCGIDDVDFLKAEVLDRGTLQEGEECGSVTADAAEG